MSEKITEVAGKAISTYESARKRTDDDVEAYNRGLDYIEKSLDLFSVAGERAVRMYEEVALA